MDKVILIQYKMKYEDGLENVGVAISKENAEKYIKELQSKYPDAYGDAHGKFYFEEFDLIGC